MKRVLLIALSLCAGAVAGWYFGYTRPVARDYRSLRDHFHLTDREMADAGTQMRDHLPQMIEGMKRNDDLMVALSLGALKRLDREDVEGAKQLLLTPVRSYYREHHQGGGDPQLMARIEEARQHHSEITADSAPRQ